MEGRLSGTERTNETAKHLCAIVHRFQFHVFASAMQPASPRTEDHAGNSGRGQQRRVGPGGHPRQLDRAGNVSNCTGCRGGNRRFRRNLVRRAGGDHPRRAADVYLPAVNKGKCLRTFWSGPRTI